MVDVTLELTMVRHASTAWSEAGRFNGHADVPLSESGRAEAGALRTPLDRMNERWDGIWTSDLSRCTETARLSVGGATPDARLRELDFGRIEGLTWEEIEPGTAEALVAFDGFIAPGGEGVDDLRGRLMDFVEGLPSGRHLVFTHGGPIRVLLGAGLRVPPCSVHVWKRHDHDVVG